MYPHSDHTIHQTFHYIFGPESLIVTECDLVRPLCDPVIEPPPASTAIITRHYLLSLRFSVRMGIGSFASRPVLCDGLRHVGASSQEVRQKRLLYYMPAVTLNSMKQLCAYYELDSVPVPWVAVARRGC